MSSFRPTSLHEREQEDVATFSNVEGNGSVKGEEPEENESFWNRITRRVIRDLMGIDDDLLSLIFGESLPEDDDLSTTPPANQPLDAAKSIIASNQYDQSSWEYRLLERISRELGILVNQISDHPGAFSTYLQSAQTPLPYAGLPVIPETGRAAPQTNTHSSQIVTQSIVTPEFQPTLQTQPLAIPPFHHLPLPHLTNSKMTPPLVPSISLAVKNGSATSTLKWYSATSAPASPHSGAPLQLQHSRPPTSRQRAWLIPLPALHESVNTILSLPLLAM